MIAITSGLNTPPIRRLKRTWEPVGQRFMAQFAACEMTIDSNRNFTKYRQLMASVTPPCVPFIGKSLTFPRYARRINLTHSQVFSFLRSSLFRTATLITYRETLSTSANARKHQRSSMTSSDGRRKPSTSRPSPLFRPISKNPSINLVIQGRQVNISGH